MDRPTNKGLKNLARRMVLRCKICGDVAVFWSASRDDVSTTCYARSTLSGCKEALLHFEKKAFTRWYTVSFGLVPVHISTTRICVSPLLSFSYPCPLSPAQHLTIQRYSCRDMLVLVGLSFLRDALGLAIIFAALLCSDHVAYRFGKGMTPKLWTIFSTVKHPYANPYRRLTNSGLSNYTRVVACFITALLWNLSSLGAASKSSGCMSAEWGYNKPDYELIEEEIEGVTADACREAAIRSNEEGWNPSCKTETAPNARADELDVDTREVGI
ncbi:hypothetical protein DFH08DRAFT_817410 [Mycena albidolilacea]|uniref:Uncharacterized protein n=1 Tax=Mycena albidolilacea TaxID=1033008 RepID=A0AAD7EHN4_9AGAR|nr:hypothetical protein DFH08DRAFT_817410 [Mycena albidolilacea]